MSYFPTQTPLSGGGYSILNPSYNYNSGGFSSYGGGFSNSNYSPPSAIPSSGGGGAIPAPGEEKGQMSVWSTDLGKMGAYSNPTLPSYYGYDKYWYGSPAYIFPTEYTSYNYDTTKAGALPTSSKTYTVDPQDAIGYGAPGQGATAPLWYKDLLESDMKKTNKALGDLKAGGNPALLPSGNKSAGSQMGTFVMMVPGSANAASNTAIPSATRSYSI